jgi:flagellum-specific ATP synthase
MASTVELMASYERNRQMVDMGAYKAGSNAGIDRAMQLFPAVREVLRQSVLESSTRQDAVARLRKAVGAAR